MKSKLQKRLDWYDELGKGVRQVIKPLAKSSLALGGVFSVMIPVSEGAIITGTVNQTVIEGNPAFNLNIDGGTDIKFRVVGSGLTNQENIQVSGPGVNGFKGTKPGNYGYPSALSIGNNISGAVVEGAGFLNTLANEKYAAGQWRLLPDATTRFLGFQLTNGNYGWVRVTKNNSASITIHDWAYDDTGAAITIIFPVELLYFKGNVKDQAVALNWKTASEIDNAGFEVQRSIDSENFETIAFVEGNGTSYDEHEYFYDDKDLRQNQIYYYRLKQIDYSGQFEYSDVITAELKVATATISNFYPNPTKGLTQLEYTANTNRELSIIVYSVNGQELIREVYNVTEGTNNLSFNYSTLSAGTYFVKLQAGEDIQYQKLIID